LWAARPYRDLLMPGFLVHVRACGRQEWWLFLRLVVRRHSDRRSLS